MQIPRQLKRLLAGAPAASGPLPLRPLAGKPAPGPSHLSYKAAAQQTHRHRDSAKWPRRGPDSRLEPHCWPELCPKFRFEQGSTIFTIGSCFARNIERQLAQRGFRVPTQAFSVPAEEAPPPNSILNKYHPFSVYFELAWAAEILQRGGFCAEDARRCLIPLPDGKVVDAQMVGFAPVSHERAVARRREVFELYRKAFSADVVVITLGLAECWWDAQEEVYIQQIPTPAMLKAWPGRFFWHRMGYEEAMTYTEAALQVLAQASSRQHKVLITTSPNPLFRTFAAQDVMVANMHAKSVLRAVSGELAERNDFVDYFPSYESVMLSRDNAVWLEDLGHVDDAFVRKIVDRLMAAYVLPGARP